MRRYELHTQNARAKPGHAENPRDEHMNAVDYALLAVLAVSGLLAFLRGLVREILGIAAWIGAAVISLWAAPFVRPYTKTYLGQYLTDPTLQDYAAFGAVFIVAVIVLLMISHWVGALVRQSPLGGVDRSLGLLFGLARGAALAVVAYIAASWLVPMDRWPEMVLQARSLPLTYQGAAWVAGQLPQPYRPMLYVPPKGKDAIAADLLYATPAGRATGAPGAATPSITIPSTTTPLGKPPARE
ncbi:MAG: CvpA family protein [Acetobacteraceae bacterium]|nr:CvpA family protein [Acetobacteraceae bacterium]MSP30406.1 CvpA family protein [Acetobacteraceae bacterium]